MESPLRGQRRRPPGEPVSRGDETAYAIRRVAAELFERQGYGATSLRQIAMRVGVQVGSLYNHIGSKEDLLSTMMVDVLERLLSCVQDGVAVEADSVDRLRAAIGCSIRFHAENSRDVFIGNSELRALHAENRKIVVSKRDRYEQMMFELVREATADDEGTENFKRLQVYSILAICSHVASWYQAGGPISIDDLVDGYTALLMQQFR